MQRFKLFLLAAGVLLACTAQAQGSAEQMTIGTSGTYPPFNAVTPSGQASGFDVEIALAMCAKIKVECTVISAANADLVPALYAHQIDFIANSMRIVDPSPDVDFTAPYYTGMLQFIGPKQAELPADPSQLKDKTVGVQRGSQAAQWAQDNLSGTSIRFYPTLEAAYADLIAGRMDALLGDKYASYDWMKGDAGQNFEFKGQPVVDNNKMGMAVRKDDPLRERLNGALKDLVTDGTYKKINDKYFPFNIY